MLVEIDPASVLDALLIDIVCPATRSYFDHNVSFVWIPSGSLGWMRV